MSLINCEIKLIVTWSSTCVITSSTGADTKRYVLVVTLSTQSNAKLLQVKSGLKITINGNKYQSKISTEAQNQYLDFLINPRFQGVNRLLVLSFENKNDRTSHPEYYLLKVEIKAYNVKIDGRNVFDQLIISDIKT